MIRKDVSFFYMFLFAGAFNDIIRLGSSELTLFRIMLPIAFLMSFCCSKKVRKLYLVFCLLMVVSLLQSLLFSRIGFGESGFSYSRYLTYLFHYVSIVTVVGVTIAIKERERGAFEKNYLRMILTVGICYLLVFIAIHHVKNIREYLYINNQNDYGAMLTMIIPLFYYKFRQRNNMGYLVVAFCVILYLVINDCKMALLGAVLQVFLIAYFGMRNKVLRWRWIIPLFFIVVFALVLVALSQTNMSLNGYNWSDTIMKPFISMMQGKMYAYSNTSVSFRVNTFIVSVSWMLKTRFIGIGIGNSGVLVRNVLGEYGLYDTWMSNDSVSLHNVFLEVILEFGFIALIGVIIILGKIIRVIQQRKLRNLDACFIVIVASSILWLQGPSGVLTDYFIYMVFAFLILTNQKQRMKRRLCNA